MVRQLKHPGSFNWGAGMLEPLWKLKVTFVLACQSLVEED